MTYVKTTTAKVRWHNKNVERGRVLPGEVCIVGVAVNEMMFRCL